MNRHLAVCSLLLVAGCSSSSTNNAGGDDASNDSAAQGQDDSSADGTTPVESSTGDAPADTAQGGDAADGGGGDAHDGGIDGGGGDADAAASDGACDPSWLQAPAVGALALPDGGVVILHAAASGTQNYTCTGTFIDGGVDGGDAGESFAWTFVGPEAELNDCNATLIGHHFASEAGATAPEWQTLDGTYVIGHKLVGYTPDGGSGSVPWLLLQATSTGGSGTLSQTAYIQRLNTSGGNAPSSGCAADAGGTTTKVPYTADYYFFGP